MLAPPIQISPSIQIPAGASEFFHPFSPVNGTPVACVETVG